MKKHVLLILALVAILSLAACVPPATIPPAATSAPTEEATPIPLPATIEVVAITPDARPTVPAPAADGSRPLAALPAADRVERFAGPAAPYIMSGTIYIATIVTDKGNIVAEIYPDVPESANNFITLALNGFYDGLTFHRVEPNFVIQGGDPAGDGSGGPGYTIPAEIIHTHPRGALAWARTGDEVNPERRSSGSQFYITTGDASFLDGGYTVFGFVIEGMDVVDQIAVGDAITRIDVTTGTVSRLPTPAPTPTPTPTPLPNPPVAREGRPLASLPLEEREGIYNVPPEMTLDLTKTYQATIATDKGDIVLDLNPEIAPMTVNNFVVLANLGYFDGMPIAHVEAGSYMVTGSPASQPASDVGYVLELEPLANASEIITGTVSMYPLGDEAGNVVASGSQFFISFMYMEGNMTPLNIFGSVSSGMDVAEQLAIGDFITTITISVK